MNLLEFLQENTPLTGVELLPDNRLINVVINNEQLYGIITNDIPPNVQVTSVVATYDNEIITTEENLTFVAADYTMLHD
jgi:hypothetical protein